MRSFYIQGNFRLTGLLPNDRVEKDAMERASHPSR